MGKRRRSLTGVVSAKQLAEVEGVTYGHALNTLSRLKKNGLARRIGRGLYAEGVASNKTLDITPALRRVARILSAQFPAVDPVVFSTAQVATLMHNMSLKEIIVVEVPRSLTGDVARALSAQGVPAQSVLTAEDMNQLVNLPGDLVVAVLPIGDIRASHRQLGVRVASPERILVELFINRTRVGLPIYEQDVFEVGKSLLADYDFSISRALDYASRRGARDETALLLKRLIRTDKRLHPFERAIA